MAKRKTTRQKTGTSVRVKGKRRSARTKGYSVGYAAGRFIVPAVICLVLIGGLIFIGSSGYSSVTASQFFSLRNIDIRGHDRTAAEDIRRIVTSSVEKPGVWNADLSEIRSKIEKFPFVKSAAVSRSLPDGIRVNVTERIPAATVRVSSGNYLIDGEAVVLAPVKPGDNEFPFVLRGWDEGKTEKAMVDNLARLKVYRKMLDEWRQFDLASRVKEVDLSDPRDPVAIIEDSGKAITVQLARDNLGKSLKTAIEAISGKGQRVRSIDSAGLYPVISYQE